MHHKKKKTYKSSFAIFQERVRHRVSSEYLHRGKTVTLTDIFKTDIFKITQKSVYRIVPKIFTLLWMKRCMSSRKNSQAQFFKKRPVLLTKDTVRYNKNEKDNIHVKSRKLSA